MTEAADNYPLLDLMWTFVLFFALMIFFWLIITVFGDLFRRHELSGWAKAGWIVLIVVLPFLGTLIYLIATPRMTAENRRAAS